MKYFYDAARNIIAVIDARGIAVYTAYDALIRPLSRRCPDPTENVVYVYDTCTNGKSELCVVRDESGENRFNYDGFDNDADRIHTVARFVSTSRFFYNSDDKLEKLTIPSASLSTTIGRIQTAKL